MSPDLIAVDLLRQELARMRGRIAFYYGCSADPALSEESREASRRVAEALARMIELFSLHREVPYKTPEQRRSLALLADFMRD